MFWIGLTVGFVSGGVTAMFIMALFAINKRDD
jgi:hypothetical protein